LQRVVDRILSQLGRSDEREQANDAFFVRFGDVLSAGLVFAGTRWLSFGSRQFALVNVALIAAWLVLAVVIGRQFERLSVPERA
jgi:hypothetical protein